MMNSSNQLVNILECLARGKGGSSLGYYLSVGSISFHFILVCCLLLLARYSTVQLAVSQGGIKEA